MNSDDLLQFFEYKHLPEKLQLVSMSFYNLAHSICTDDTGKLPDNSERTMALRKLLEAKDCAVRAVIFK